MVGKGLQSFVCSFFLEIGFSVELHGVHENNAVLVRAFEDQEVARKVFVFVDFDEFSHLDLGPGLGLKHLLRMVEYHRLLVVHLVVRFVPGDVLRLLLKFTSQPSFSIVNTRIAAKVPIIEPGDFGEKGMHVSTEITRK